MITQNHIPKKEESHMNKIYKVIWSKAKNCYVVVSELAKRVSRSASPAKAGRVSLAAILAATALTVGTIAMDTAQAAPTYGTVDVDGYDYDGDIAKTATSYSGVMYDGGWYAPDGKFYTYVNANGVITDTLIACDVVGGKAVLTAAQENKLVSMGLDHNEQADAVADNKRVPSYLDIMGGNKFTAANVATALADNLKFNSDLVRTVCQWEEADRKATDKFLNEKIDTIGVTQGTDGHSFTFTSGSGTKTTINFADFDTDTNTTVNGVTTTINAAGVITTTVKSSDGTSKSDTVSIDSFVDNSITNNAQNATVTVDGTKTTITEAINQNTTNITNNTNKITNLQKDVTNIEQTYVSDITENVINNDYKTWTITQGGETTTITDKYITGFDKDSISVGEDGTFTTTITRNDGSSFSQTVDMSGYVGDMIRNEAVNATYQTIVNEDGSTTNVTIGDAITNNYNNIQEVKNNYVTNITEGGVDENGNITNRNEHYWTVNQFIDGKETPVTIKDLNTTNDKLENAWGNGDDITITLTDTDGESVKTTLTNIAKASDVDNLTEVIGAGTKQEIINQYGDTNYITNEDTLIDADIKLDQEIKNINDNNVTNITKNNNNSWTVTQTIDGTENEVTITDTVTTASLGQSSNLMLQETIDQQNNTIHYTIDLKDDVTFNSVTANTVSADTINSTTANLGTVNAGNINATQATIGTVNANEVNANTFNGNIGNFNTVNGGTANFNTVNAGAINSNTVGTGTIYLGTSNEFTTITYDNGSDRITYDDNVIATLDDGMKYGADQGDDLSLKLNEKLTVAGDKNITTISAVDGTINVTLNDEITVETVNSTTVNSTTVNVGDNITIEEGNVDMGGNKITNVYEGDIYQGSMDAVNGGQLWQTNQNLNRLGDRMNKVGAGAAALAALHPLDFDPDDKLSFAAGVGNYGGATASAIGAFYRPDERTMFSIGGTIGNGENMVNAGISFALGKGGKINNSRVAMTHEINDLRQQVAYLSAVVAQMAAQSGYQFTDMKPFPDTPENHWAYEYVAKLAAEGIIEGYPDGNFSGDRTMTRYEYAAMLFRALEKGFQLDTRVIDEFEPELGRLSVERIRGEQNQKNKIERVRVNDSGEDRDVYGGKITVGKTWP